MSVTRGWLRCERVDRGMFSDERAVVVSRSNGEKESYFVPSSEVEEALRRVRVSLQESGSVIWATLPTPDHATIPVNKSYVETA